LTYSRWREDQVGLRVDLYLACTALYRSSLGEPLIVYTGMVFLPSTSIKKGHPVPR